MCFRGLNDGRIERWRESALTGIKSAFPAVAEVRQQEKGNPTMGSKKAGLTDTQADAIAAVIIVATVVVAAVYWVATAA